MVDNPSFYFLAPLGARGVTMSVCLSVGHKVVSSTESSSFSHKWHRQSLEYFVSSLLGIKCLQSKYLNTGKRRKEIVCFHGLFMEIKANLNIEMLGFT